MPDDPQYLRHEALKAAHSEENLGESPVKGFVLNRLEAIVREADLELDDPRILELARRAYLRGVIDRDITLRDLLEPLGE